MPRGIAPGGPKITYPAGCKEISEEITKDELVRRLKLLAKAFQDMSQDENNEFKQLALYLATEFFLEHPNKDARLLVACCIADIFRIFAPDAPYTDQEHLKDIFLFLTNQLRGLEDPDSPTFKRYFYLLENLAWVKSFNICIELEENQEIFCTLYKLMFTIVNSKHSNKVINFMLDMMCPLITEADSVSQELLDIILVNIIEPHKTQKPHAFNLAKDLIRRTAGAMEPYIQAFFNNALMLGKTSESDVSERLYDLIYELNDIAPSVLLAVLPQLEFKLKTSDDSDRKQVTKLLSKMFSNPESDLAVQTKPLWQCYLGRFNDIDITVRKICVTASQDFIVNHPELVKDIEEPLKTRQHDPDESVRMEVVQSIVGAAKKEFANVSDMLLDIIKERTLDKKFKIRKEALMGLGQIFKKCTLREDIDKKEVERISWIRNKVLYAYYQTGVEDRILVERILNMSLVPYSMEPDDRMKRLFVLYGTIDDYAVKALHEIFKIQCNLRNLLKSLLELHNKPKDNPDVQQLIKQRLMQISRNLPEPMKALDYVRKFNKIIGDDPRIRNFMGKMVSSVCTCKHAEESVKEVLKKTGNPIPTNYLYTHVKMILERVAPVMIDSSAIKSLLRFIDDAVNGMGEICDDVPDAIEKGMKLLLMLSFTYPGAFQDEEIFTHLMSFVKHEDETVSDVTMQVFANVGSRLELAFTNIYSSLLPVLQKMVKIGSPRQAKHAIRAISTLCRNRDKIFKQIFEHLKKNMELDSPNFLTSLVSIGHMAQLCPGEFAAPVKAIVSKFIVKELLMQDRARSRPTTEDWYADHLVSEETQAKVQAVKMMVRWLLGLRSNASNSGTSTLRLLHTLILHEGDLMERGKVNKAEMARLRLQAGCSILKLAQEHCYESLITLEQFQATALLLNDPCKQVREQFSQKLHKGLLSLRLPLPYMAIFGLVANDPLKERKVAVKQQLAANIQKRREYLKQNQQANMKMFLYLPDYVLPYAIHLFAHDPDFTDNQDVDTLKNIKECLWFIMEPLITKNENYSYSFYKKIIENIKQTKDAQDPENTVANHKLYAVCDLALGLVMTKTTNFVLKDGPADPVLPAKLFTQADQNYTNLKSYLPPELVMQAGKQKKGIVPGMSPLAPPTPVTSSARQSSVVLHASDRKPASPPSDLADSPESTATSDEEGPDSPGGTTKSRKVSTAPRSRGRPAANSASKAATGGKRGRRPKKRESSVDGQEQEPAAKKGKRSVSNDAMSPPSSPRRAVTPPPSTRPPSKRSTKGIPAQGKITDFVSVTSKNKQQQSDSTSDSAASPSKRGGSGGSKAGTPAKKGGRGRGASRQHTESEGSTVESEVENNSSPVKKPRGGTKLVTNDVLPLPTSPTESGSSSTTSTPIKRGRGRPSKSNAKKTKVLNGTSDGESGTPESHKLSSQNSSIGGVKRGRGRPPSSDNSSQESKKRGATASKRGKR